MGLADTMNAIGAVTEMLQLRLQALSGSTVVTVGKPEDSDDQSPHLNLFLYQIEFDPYLKNTPLNEGEKPPLWMVLKYLLTAYSAKDVSDTIVAHQRLGGGIRALNRNDLINIGANTTINKALSPNPQELHITFDESTSDLLAKLMQGTDEKYRLSICFQVRPVMIAPAEPGEYSLLVGIDYIKTPPAYVDEEPFVKPIGIDVIPSIGPTIERIDPVGFEVGEEVTIYGTDLHLANLSVILGSAELPVVMQQPGQLRFRISQTSITLAGISAGSHLITVAQFLPHSGKKRRSNAVVGNLVPSLHTAAISAVIIGNPGPPVRSHRELNLTGAMLVTVHDDILVAFYKNGGVQQTLDDFIAGTGAAADQTTRNLRYTPPGVVPPGDYLLTLLVNGQRATNSVHVTIA